MLENPISRGDPNQKLEYINVLFNRWRRLLTDKPWSDLVRLVAEEMAKLESTNMPVIVRSSKGRTPNHSAGKTNNTMTSVTNTTSGLTVAASPASTVGGTDIKDSASVNM
ncbi:unnamed protein product [Protopolystoma xenopodis]|uniref:Uncharacterized protein n=1 Tax=Protopolystoma xenopodis TaxID=117903 RepID=A0A3S5CPY9_9PLAT|nr:unnamed protein product [Protopolystoma xenopodis]